MCMCVTIIKEKEQGEETHGGVNRRRVKEGMM